MLDDAVRYADHTGMMNDHDPFFNFDDGPELYGKALDALAEGRFPAIMGLVMQAIDREEAPEDILGLSNAQRHILAIDATYARLTHFLFFTSMVDFKDRSARRPPRKKKQPRDPR